MKTRMLFAMVLAVASLGAADLPQAQSIGEFSESARADLERVIRSSISSRAVAVVSGTVTHAGNGFFFLQNGKEALKVVSNAHGMPATGTAVQVGGLPSLEGGRLVVVASSWKRTGEAELPPTERVDGAALTFVAENAAERGRDVNWRRVEVEGRAIGLTDSGFAIEVDSVPVTVVTEDLPDFVRHCETTHPLVKVTGVVELILDQSVLFGGDRYVMGVKLHAAGVSDIQLDVDPVYLMNCGDRRIRIAVIVAFAVVLLLLVLLIALAIRQARRRLRTTTLMTERKRMADDLHDTIEQHLVGAGMLLQLGKVREAGDILVRAKREMRDIVWGLKNDDMMRLTPAQMIKEFAKDENRKGLYRVEAMLAGLPERLDASAMRDLSLIVREAVGNAVKHGKARKVAISGDPKPDGGWIIRIGNDGTPFDPATAPGAKEGHFGIEGMKARARRLHAAIRFEKKGERTVFVLETQQ